MCCVGCRFVSLHPVAQAARPESHRLSGGTDAGEPPALRITNKLMNHDQEYIREFVAESREGLDRIDNVLVALEANPGDRSGLDVVFRALHTIKGNAGFLEFPKLGAVAHAGESLLSKLFGGTLTVSGDVADVLLRLVDAIRNVLAEVEETGREGANDHKALIQELERWTKMAGGGVEKPASNKSTGELGGVSPRTGNEPIQASSEPVRGLTPTGSPNEMVQEPTAAYAPASPVQPPKVAPPKGPQPQIVVEEGPSESVLQKGDSSSISILGGRSSDGEHSSFIRVQIDHLDELMNLVGELVLTRNRIVQIASSRQDDEMTEPIQRLHRLTAALQDGVMRTRMQPVRNAWRKYPRIVRDLAKQCGKLCEVELQGGDTELDKSMLEAIADPLVHLVRNAIDHGIEKPYLRKIKGKPETGRLLVRAFQESGQVHIEVSDDGAGLDLERIRKKAVEAGIIAAERAHQVSESDLRNSVFLPGFTTADKVTNLSGRGVGLDVVKTCVEEIGGTIELQTRKDVGTTIRLTVPLTLAIVPAIMVACGQQRFAVPQINVVEMLHLRGEEQQHACDHFHDTPVLRLRGELLPMADLCAKLGVQSRYAGSRSRETSMDSPQTPNSHEFGYDATRETLDIVVLKTGTRRYALLVDEIGDAQEIVVKPLGELLSSQTEYSGAAMLGDGNIALILDVLGIARSAGLFTAEQTMLSGPVTVREEIARLDEQVLVCTVDGEHQIALPLANVVCLEQVLSATVEHSATGDMVQYRGEILTLHPLSQRPSPATTVGEPEVLSVVIYRTADAQLGLLVDHIVDIAPRPMDLKPIELAKDSDSRHRVIGTAVVLGRVTDFLQVT